MGDLLQRFYILPPGELRNTTAHGSGTMGGSGAAVKTCAFGEGQAIKNGAGKGSEGAEMATEDPSNAGTAYPGREQSPCSNNVTRVPCK